MQDDRTGSHGAGSHLPETSFGSGDQPRVEPRTSLLIAATVGRIGQAEAFPVQVKNLSATGLGGKSTAAAFRVGEPLQVHFHQGDMVAGRVVWMKDDRFGLAFDRSIDPKALLRIRTPVHQSPALVTSAGNFRRPAVRPRFGQSPDD